MQTKGLIPRLWRKIKKIIFFLFIAHLLYIVALKWVFPPITITQLSNWVAGNGLQRDYISGSSISPNAKLAVLASEDQLYTEHDGFDWESINKVLEQSKKNPKKKMRGASTISQQVAKNVFLWQGRSWVRKGLEMYFTFMIEMVWGKERILDMYLNVIEMGKGVFGIEKAAQIYFNKPASQLTRSEAAMIAASLPNPKKYTVKPLSGYVAKRSKWVLRQMSFIAPQNEIKDVIGLDTLPRKKDKERKK